jgi:hypothetical protein
MEKEGCGQVRLILGIECPNDGHEYKPAARQSAWKSFSSGCFDTLTKFVYPESGHFITTGIHQVAVIPFTAFAQLCNAA